MISQSQNGKTGHLLEIDSWLDNVRQHITDNAPSLLPIFDVYEGEARFGRQYIGEDITSLDYGAAVLEVGAGSLLLSCQLAREGFSVTALEPKGEGFSHFIQMQKLILECADRMACVPIVVNMHAEDMQYSCQYDYAFSINVMEHVNDVGQVIMRVGSSLKQNAKYHFTCPNYLFPYEPHFNIPTVFSKKITRILLHKKIFHNKELIDPEGLWKSLNWINVLKLRHIINKNRTLNILFNRKFVVSSLERIAYDEKFSARRSGWLVGAIKLFVKLRIHLLASFIPVIFQPVIDCTIMKQSSVLGKQ